MSIKIEVRGPSPRCFFPRKESHRCVCVFFRVPSRFHNRPSRRNRTWGSDSDSDTRIPWLGYLFHLFSPSFSHYLAPSAALVALSLAQETEGWCCLWHSCDTHSCDTPLGCQWHTLVTLLSAASDTLLWHSSRLPVPIPLTCPVTVSILEASSLLAYVPPCSGFSSCVVQVLSSTLNTWGLKLWAIK